MIPQFGSHEWLTSRRARTAACSPCRAGRRSATSGCATLRRACRTRRGRRRCPPKPATVVPAGIAVGREDPEPFGAGRRDGCVRIEPGLLHGTSPSVAAIVATRRTGPTGSGTLHGVPEVSVFEIVGGQPFFDALVDALLRARRTRSRAAPRCIPRTSRPGSARSRCSSRSTGAARLTYSAEKGHPRLRMRHAPFAIGAPGAGRVARRDARRARRHAARPKSAKDAMREYFEMAATAMINSGATNGRDEQAAAAGEDGAPARRVGAAGTAPPAGRDPGRPPLARPAGAGRDPAPAVRARRAGAACPRCRPTSSPTACASPAAPAREVLLEPADAVRVGITTDELDRICHEACIARGGYPSPLHYKGFPKSLCTSVNEVICHGIPDDRVLARRRHRQLRRHDLPARRARRLQRDVPRRRRRRRRAASSCSHEGSAVEGHRRGAPRRAASTTSAARSRTHAEARGLRRRARVRRPRRRRGVPHRAVGAALLRPARRHADRRRA